MSEIDRLRWENINLLRANKRLHQANRNYLWNEHHSASRLRNLDAAVSELQSQLAELRELLGPSELCAIPQPARMRISEIVFGEAEMNCVNRDDITACESGCAACDDTSRLVQALAIARHEAATHELVKREAMATVGQLEQQVTRQRDTIQQLKDRAEIVRDQLNTADSRAKEAVQQEMAGLRALKICAEQELTDVLVSLANLLECDMQEFSQPSASGNHQLRRVVLLTQQIIRLQKMANDRVAAVDQPHPIASLMDELRAGRADASEVQP